MAGRLPHLGEGRTFVARAGLGGTRTRAGSRSGGPAGPSRRRRNRPEPSCNSLNPARSSTDRPRDCVSGEPCSSSCCCSWSSCCSISSIRFSIRSLAPGLAPAAPRRARSCGAGSCPDGPAASPGCRAVEDALERPAAQLLAASICSTNGRTSSGSFLRASSSSPSTVQVSSPLRTVTVAGRRLRG